MIDEDSPHCFRGRYHEMRVVFPRGLPGSSEEPKVYFVNESRCLQRMVWSFLSQPRPCKRAEFVIEERHQPCKRCRAVFL